MLSYKDQQIELHPLTHRWIGFEWEQIRGYGLMNRKTNRFDHLEVFSKATADSLEQLLVHHYPAFSMDASVGCDAAFFTLIPDAVGRDIPYEVVAKQMGFESTEKLNIQPVQGLEGHLLFASEQHYALPVVSFQGKVLEAFLQKMRVEPGNAVLADVRNRHFYLYIFEDGQLQLANRFAYQTAADFVYFTLFACEETGISSDYTRLLLGGAIVRDGEIFPLISRYFRKVEFWGAQPSFTPENWGGFKPHYFLPLNAIAL